MSKTVEIEIKNEIGYLVLKREPANAINRQFVGEIGKGFDELTNDNRCRVIVISSGLPKFFAAGADIDMILKFSKAESEDTTRFFQDSFSRIANSKKLTIAAINGFALGGGCELILCCDYRIAMEGSYIIGLPETTLGIIPGAGGTQRLPRLIGYHNAFKIIVKGKGITPDDAKKIGLVDEVVKKDKFKEYVNSFAEKTAAGAIRAKEAAKAAILGGMDRSIDKGLSVELSEFVDLFSTEDAKEGLTSFLEKRKPNFKGK